MTRARDVANVLSTATSLATDTETAAAISSHNSATTSVHGITNTAVLATQTYVDSAVSTHATAANGHVGRGTTANRPASPSVGDTYFDTTLDTLVQYKTTGWAQLAPPPNAPTIGTATINGSNSASITFTAPTTGPTVNSYKVTSSPGSITATGSSSPITITGLTTGTSYTFTVIAIGDNGESTASSASNSITAATTPSAPTIGTVTRVSDTSVSVPFTAGSNGSSTITSYTIVSSPSISLTYSGTTSPISVTGSFVIDTNYTFTIAATNAVGTSSASSSSNSLKPNPKTIGSWADSGTYAITYTLGPSGSSNGSNLYSLTGRGASTGYAQQPLIYTRTAASTTWSSTSSSYPTGYGQYHSHFKINNRWYLGNSEYGGPQVGWYSWPYSGTTWTTETSYPINVCYSGGGQIGTTGYVVGGYFQGSTNVDTNKVYSYTGSGSWTAQTDYPSSIRVNREIASVNNKVYVTGGQVSSSGSQNLTVYSYSGSGSWVAETSMPEASSNHSAIGANGRVYVINNSGKVYSYSGSGTWKLENNQAPYNSNATYLGGEPPAVAELSSKIYIWAGTYGNSTTYVAEAALQ